MPKKIKKKYSYGEVFSNPYLGDKTIEVLNSIGIRVGWIWQHSDGTIVVSPHIGFYVWFAENGSIWNMESATNWLVNKSNFRKIGSTN